MTDEEVLNLLADSKISVSPESEKKSIRWGSVQQIPLQNLPEAGRLSFPLPVF